MADAVAAFTGHLNDLYRYSPQGEWEVLVQDEMLVARARLRLSALGGRIYLFGGLGVSGMPVCLHLHWKPCIMPISAVPTSLQAWLLCSDGHMCTDDLLPRVLG
jgi:hypothetical protein